MKYYRLVVCLIGLSYCGSLRADIQVQGYLNNAALENLAADPACAPAITCPEGRIFWDSVLNKFRVWDGTIWGDVLFGAAAVPDPLLLSDGTEALPTFGFINFGGTGMRAAASSLNFSVLGENKISLTDATGTFFNNTGLTVWEIYGTAGTARLDIKALANNSEIYFSDAVSGAGRIIYDQAANDMDFYIDSTKVMALEGGATALLKLTPSVAGQDSFIYMGDVADSARARIHYDNSTEDLVFRTEALNALTLRALTTDTSVFTATISAESGTAGHPTYASDIDADSGMYFPSASNVSLSIAGTSRFSVDTNSINSIEPIFTHNGTALLPAYSFTSNQTDGMYSDSNNALGFATNGVKKFAVGSDNNIHYNESLGVPGTASLPSFAFSGDPDSGMYNRSGTHVGISVGGADKFIVGASINRSNQQFQTVDGGASAPGYSFSNDTNTGMAKPGTTLGLYYNGSAMLLTTGSSYTKIKFNTVVGGNTVCTGGAAGGLNELRRCSSSERYKKDIADINNTQSSKLYALRPVAYKWKHDDKDDFGFIAEEVKDLFPRLVATSKDKDGKLQYDSVNYRHLTSLLVKEIQNLKSKLDTLENKNISILARLDALEATP